MKSIVWSDRALTRRDEIFDYIAEDNPEAAIDLDTSFEVAVERLRDFPLSGRTGKVEGTRELIVTSLFTRYPIRLLILSHNSSCGDK